MNIRSANQETVQDTTNGTMTIVANGYELRVPQAALTLDGFRQWATTSRFPEYGRVSFIGQELIVDMSPEEINHHGQVKAEVSFVVTYINKKKNRGKFFPDRTLISHRGAGLATEPDGAFVLWETLESGRIQLVARAGEAGEYVELQGTPDWLLEIVSKHSLRKDTKLLREKYYVAGVPEFWLIHARETKVDFQILLHGTGGYRPVASRAGWQRSQVFGYYFRLERKRGRAGLWEYTLRFKQR